MNPYNPDTNDGVIMSEHKIVPITFYRRIGIGFLVITTFIGFCWVTVYYYVAPQQYIAELDRRSEAEIAELKANDPGTQFLFVVDPTSLPLLSVIQNQTVEMLRSDYTMAQENITRGDDGQPVREDIWSVGVNNIAYGEFINLLSADLQISLSQMHDEVREAARVMADNHQTPSLAARIGETNLLYPDLAVPRVNKNPAFYPNPFTLEAYLVTGLLARVLPDQAQYYEQRAEEIAMAGVAYGHYSIAEKDVMKAYIAWYLSEAEKNPAFPTLITSMQAIANQTVQ